MIFRHDYKKKLCITKACISQNFWAFFLGGGRASRLVLYDPSGSSRYQNFLFSYCYLGHILKQQIENVPLKLYLLI